MLLIVLDITAISHDTKLSTEGDTATQRLISKRFLCQVLNHYHF